MRRLAALLLLTLAFAPLPAQAQSTDTEVADLEEGAAAELVWSGLAMPVDIALDADGTLYYAAFEKGELRRVAPGGEDTLWTAPNLQLGGERGFVGLALAPDFDITRTFYVNYQTNKSGTPVTRLSRVTDGIETVLLDDIRSEKLHNSGRLVFTPDGYLLMSVGDAIMDTAGRQKAMHAHDPADLHGKVLRLTPDGQAAPGNPWGNEVWTKGHRNVYGLAVSPDGVVLGTENGPESWDEINVLQAGNDYGWPTCSGACATPGHVDPLLSYESTIAPTGAVWHEGAFYFTDFNKGSVHRVYPRADGTWADERVLKFTTPRILDIATGPDGLYLSTWDSVWRLTVSSSVPGVAPATPDDAGAGGTAGATPTLTGQPSAVGNALPTASSEATAPPPAPGASAIPGAGVSWVFLVVVVWAWRGRR